MKDPDERIGDRRHPRQASGGPPRCEDGDGEWLVGGGALGELIRAFDWSSTPLGPRSSWSAALRTSVGLVVESPLPMALRWGPELSLLYNDACTSVVGDRHPQALGAGMIDDIPEEARHLRARYLEVLESGRSFSVDHEPWVTVHHGEREQVLLSSRWSPVREADGSVGGVLVAFQETTAERAHLLSLEAKEAQQRLVLDNTQDGINVLDLRTGRYTYMSPAQVALTGFTAEELNELSAEEAFARVHPDDRDRSVAQQRGIAAGEDPGGKPVEYRWRVKSGEYRWFSDTRRLLRDEAGAPFALVGISRDITDRKLAEEMLRVREARLSSIFSAVPTALALSRVDDGVLVAANESFFKLFETSSEQAVGRTARDLGVASAEEQAEVRAALRKDGAVRNLRVTRRTTTGRSLHLALDLDLVVSAGERYVLTTVHDLSTGRLALEDELRRQAHRRHVLERELDEAEARYRSVVESALDAIVTVDERGIIETVNRAAEEIFGYAASEILGGSAAQLLPPARRGNPERNVRRYLEDVRDRSQGRGREMSARKKDGTVFPIHLAVTELRVGGRRVFAGFVRDLTEQRALENQLSHAQKMEAIGTLTSGIAHDFGNLLMGIGGCADVALGQLPAGASAAPLLHDLKAAVSRGADLCQRLLSFSSNRKVEPIPLRLDEVVLNARALLAQLVGDDISLEVETRLPPTACILATAGQLEQILVNLVVNARDAMPRGGSIEIRTAEVELDPHRAGLAGLPPGRYATLLVRDTGDGMTPETRARAFEPFFTTKPAGRGTGLGLATVYGIVRQLRGGVQLESEAGAGTAFTLSFPLSGNETGERREQEEEARAAPGVTILLVDDDRLVRMAVRHYLIALGYDVLEADGAEGALQTCAEHADEIDLLLTDVVMPRMSGKELAGRVREICGRSVPVLFLSAHPFDELQARQKLADDDDVLHKPFERADLAAAVERRLQPVRP